MNVSELLGKRLVSVYADEETITFKTEEGKRYQLYHDQDCCEHVYIESIVGDLKDLVGEPILIASEENGDTPNDFKFEYEPESYTWTFYKFATRKGYVDIRWLGTSNGYYGEVVSFREIK